MSPVHARAAMLVAALVAAPAGVILAGGSAAGSFAASSRPENVMTPPNSTPTGVDDEFEVVQDTRLVVGAPGVLANDSDPDGDPIIFGFSSSPAHGTILAFAQDGAFTYEPDPGFVGVDTFLYSVQDDQGNFTGPTVGVTITVTAAPDPTTAPNRPPDAVDDAYDVVEGESLNVAVLIGVLANDSDPDGDPIEVTATTQPANGSVSMSPQGSFAYTPDPGFSGVDSFLYEVSDDLGNSTGLVVEVVITVTATSAPDSTDPPNGPPVGVDDAFEVVEGETLDVEAPGLLANDSDPEGDPLRVSLVSDPANGDSSVFQVGAFQYTPDPGFVGVDSFLYEVSDDQAHATGLVVEVTITVIPASASTSTDGAPATVEDSADGDPLVDPAPPTEPAPTEPVAPASTVAPVSTVEADPADTSLAGADEPAAGGGAAVGASGAAVTTTTPSGQLPATGAESIALGLGALLVVAGSFVTALGSIATHGARRAGRGHHARR